MKTACLRLVDTWRIVPSRFPPVGLFDRVADPVDLDTVLAVESLTNDRLRVEVGDLALIADADKISGPGTTPIMAAFTHLNPDGSRFSDGSFGIYYCARDIETAIKETQYHRSEFLLATNQASIELDMRVYRASFTGECRDIRGVSRKNRLLCDPDSYVHSQRFGLKIKQLQLDGIIYPSARKMGGECVAAMRPNCLSQCKQERHLVYQWDGDAFIGVYEKRAF